MPKLIVKRMRSFVEEAIASSTDQCILWPWGKSLGYGWFTPEGQNREAVHAYVCKRAHGDKLSSNLDAGHLCRHKHCINPRHLEWQTRSINQKRRALEGTRKLTPEQAEEIREAQGSVENIASHFKISKSLVYQIKKGELYAVG